MIYSLISIEPGSVEIVCSVGASCACVCRPTAGKTAHEPPRAHDFSRTHVASISVVRAYGCAPAGVNLGFVQSLCQWLWRAGGGRPIQEAGWVGHNPVHYDSLSPQKVLAHNPVPNPLGIRRGYGRSGGRPSIGSFSRDRMIQRTRKLLGPGPHSATAIGLSGQTCGRIRRLIRPVNFPSMFGPPGPMVGT